MSGRGSWARVLTPRVLFGAGACAALMIALLLGWLTGLRSVMHALLITLGAHALVPFVLVLAVVAVLSAAALTTALIVDDTRGGSAMAAAIGSRPARAYDEQIRRQRRHPLGWGLSAGLGLGVVGVWLVLAALVVPLETRTLSILLLAQARLDSAGRGSTPPGSTAAGSTAAGSTPPGSTAPGSIAHREIAQGGAPADGLLYPSAWNGASDAASSPVLDGFGHALAYRGDVPGGAYALRSLGLDGVPSGDDLCVVGQRTPRAEGARDPLAFLESLRDGRLGWSAQLGALARARCDVSER